MNTLSTFEELSNLPGPIALAIGMFDGVHLGHREVIRGALDYAAEHHGTAVVLTFDPHPLQVLRPEVAPRLLCSTRHKLRLLASLGVEHTLLYPFNRATAKMSALEFVESLVLVCRPLGLVSVGRSWSFGSGREGNIHKLAELGQQFGFEVHGVPDVHAEGGIVSSTRVREAVRAADFVKAKILLGRNYTVLGKIEKGKQPSRQPGFPTANILVENEELPPNGVYAVSVQTSSLAQSSLKWVVNLDLPSTFEIGAADCALPALPFNFGGDLNISEMEVAFVKRINQG
ncbi:MAG: bifunctional riboflavin kinase/FAD synthetase [Verrucomicrobia bacterium]|nr:bifunctional riboflavin kinase/FAD synthetase [Verrucomicrobiota bacterium]